VRVDAAIPQGVGDPPGPFLSFISTLLFDLYPNIIPFQFFNSKHKDNKHIILDHLY